jgi:hypothetical protein
MRLIISIIKQAIRGCIHKQEIGCQIPLPTAFYDAKFRCRQARPNKPMLLKYQEFSPLKWRFPGLKSVFSLLSGKMAFALARSQTGQMYTPRMPPSG